MYSFDDRKKYEKEVSFKDTYIKKTSRRRLTIFVGVATVPKALRDDRRNEDEIPGRNDFKEGAVSQDSELKHRTGLCVSSGDERTAI